MRKRFQITFISACLICVSGSMSTTAVAQMGNSSTSNGKVKITTYQEYKPIPSIEADAIEGIQRNSVITGGGFVNHGELLLPESPALDRRNRIHDSVKHPYETVPSLQNTRLDLIH